MRAQTLIALGFAIIVVPWLIVAVFAVGPLFWMAGGLALILLGFGKFVVNADFDDHPQRQNCADCGAPNDPTDEHCTYCNAEL